MKGSYFHNVDLVQRLARAARALGACVSVEYPVARGQRPRSVDIFLLWEIFRIVIEVGCSIARIGGEIPKAQNLKADLLLLVLPTPRLAAAARRKLRRLGNQKQTATAMQIRVLTLGLALDALRRPEILRQWANPRSTPDRPQASRTPFVSPVRQPNRKEPSNEDSLG